MRPKGFEDYLGVRIKVVHWYQAWGSGNSRCVPELCLKAHSRNMIPLISWEPWKLPTELPAGNLPNAQPDYSLDKIASGMYDNYIRSWADCLRRCAQPVFLRPMHEMNGNWYPWAGVVNGNDPHDFIRAWKHLHHIFAEEKADNVRWVWCPFAHSVPDTPENALEQYFPGENFVDWLAVDLYNHCTQNAIWQSFSQIFADPYQRMLTLAPDKPVMIAEIGCAEAGGNKALWIKEALSDLKEKFPRVEVLVWFHIDKECDWQIDSSPAALAAFREAGRCFSP